MPPAPYDLERRVRSGEVAKRRGVSENYGFPRLVGEGRWGDSNKTHSNKQQRTSSNEHQGKKKRNSKNTNSKKQQRRTKKQGEQEEAGGNLVVEASGASGGPVWASWG